MSKPKRIGEFVALVESGADGALADYVERILGQRDELLAALKDCDNAFAAWQCGQIPGRPDDIYALIVAVRAAIAKAEGQ